MEGFIDVVNTVITTIDDFVWGVPLMVLILFGGILLTVRLGGLQFRQLPRALRYMVKKEKGGSGELSAIVREALREYLADELKDTADFWEN